MSREKKTLPLTKALMNSSSNSLHVFRSPMDMVASIKTYPLTTVTSKYICGICRKSCLKARRRSILLPTHELRPQTRFERGLHRDQIRSIICDSIIDAGSATIMRCIKNPSVTARLSFWYHERRVEVERTASYWTASGIPWERPKDLSLLYVAIDHL